MPDKRAAISRGTRSGPMSTPEHLDRVLALPSTRSWLALLTFVLVTVAVVLWSVLGEISTYVEAHGFLLNRGGTVVDAVAASEGRLDHVAVAPGDTIERGGVVARIVNEGLAERHAGALALLAERRERLAALEAALAEESRVATAGDARRRRRLDELETTAQEMLELARDHLESNRRLFEKRVIARVSMERSQEEFNEARRALLDVGRDRDALEMAAVRRENDHAVRLREMEAQVRAAEREADELAAVLDTHVVLAPVSGRITEIKATTGSIVRTSQPLASIRTGADALDVLLYVPPAEGKQVEAGMPALVSPVTFRREEFGAVRGTVASLSAFPVSLEGMVAVLQNRSLAEHFSDEGPPYAGRIALVPDSSTESGFAWTSPKGASRRLSSGTLAAVEIEVRSQPPITLAVPLLKELMGIR